MVADVFDSKNLGRYLQKIVTPLTLLTDPVIQRHMQLHLHLFIETEK